MLDDGSLDPQGNGFRTTTHDDDALEEAFQIFEKRAAALEAHATYDAKRQGYNVCFISMQMDWDALIERACKISAR